MKQPKKTVTITLSPRQRKERREADARKKLMASVKEDQVWKHEGGTEYTTILLTNQKATKQDYHVTVAYYGPDGNYWSQTLERFIQDKVFVRNLEPTLSPAEDELGGWLSAALEDPGSCKEFKQAVENWFQELPFPKTN